MELILIIVIFILAILYWLELLKNVKLEKERDIECFEKNYIFEKMKKLKSFEERKVNLMKKIEDKNKRIALLCSKVQSKDKIIAKLRENGKV